MSKKSYFLSLLVLLALVFCASAVYNVSANLSPDTLQWVKVNNPTNSSLHSIAMTSTDNGWAIGFSGASGILHWDGANWQTAGSIPLNAGQGDIFMNNSNSGWIVAGGPIAGFEPVPGIIMRWNGTTWMDFADFPDASFSSIDMLLETEGWTIAQYGMGTRFYKWDGSTWQLTLSTTSPTRFYGKDIDMVSSQDGWAVGWAPFGGNSNIMRWDGSNWSYFDSPVTTTYLYSIAMVSATNGWSVGENGVILHWDGNTWSQYTSPTTTRLRSVSMLSATDGWSVGDDGVVLHWNGSAWSSFVSPTNNQLDAVKMVTNTDGWAGGFETILHYYNYVPPQLSINYPTGQPGSFFTLTGTNFPPNSTATITVNGNILGSVLTDSSGNFTFLLNTSLADEGHYTVTVTVNPSASAPFVLDSSEPLRPQEGSGTIFNVPSGIAYTHIVYLPLILR